MTSEEFKPSAGHQALIDASNRFLINGKGLPAQLKEGVDFWKLRI